MNMNSMNNKVTLKLLFRDKMSYFYLEASAMEKMCPNSNNISYVNAEVLSHFHCSR